MVYLSHFLAAGAYNGLDKIRTTEKRWESSFTTCISGLYYLSLSWAIARAMLRAIQLSIPELGFEITDLPKEVQEIFQILETKLWNPSEIPYIQSTYPMQNALSLTQWAGHMYQKDWSKDGLEHLLKTLDKVTNIG
jgi:hypothetical protein